MAGPLFPQTHKEKEKENLRGKDPQTKACDKPDILRSLLEGENWLPKVVSDLHIDATVCVLKCVLPCAHTHTHTTKT